MGQDVISTIELGLLNKIRLGDVDGITDSFFNYCELMYSEMCCNDYVHTRTAELIMLVNREARELGVSAEQIVALSSHLLGKYREYSLQCSSQPNFCTWIYNEILTKYCLLIAQKKSNQSNKIIEKSIKFIRSNLDKDCTLEIVSSYVYISTFHLSHLFSKIEKKTFIEFVKEERIKSAKSLLLDQNIPIKQVASQVGFKSVSYFTKIFKETVNMTPKQYRLSKEVT